MVVQVRRHGGSTTRLPRAACSRLLMWQRKRCCSTRSWNTIRSSSPTGAPRPHSRQPKRRRKRADRKSITRSWFSSTPETQLELTSTTLHHVSNFEADTAIHLNASWQRRLPHYNFLDTILIACPQWTLYVCVNKLRLSSKWRLYNAHILLLLTIFIPTRQDNLSDIKYCVSNVTNMG